MVLNKYLYIYKNVFKNILIHDRLTELLLSRLFPLCVFVYKLLFTLLSHRSKSCKRLSLLSLTCYKMYYNLI